MRSEPRDRTRVISSPAGEVEAVVTPGAVRLRPSAPISAPFPRKEPAFLSA